MEIRYILNMLTDDDFPLLVDVRNAELFEIGHVIKSYLFVSDFPIKMDEKLLSENDHDHDGLLLRDEVSRFVRRICKGYNATKKFCIIDYATGNEKEISKVAKIMREVVLKNEYSVNDYNNNNNANSANRYNSGGGGVKKIEKVFIVAFRDVAEKFPFLIKTGKISNVSLVIEDYKNNNNNNEDQAGSGKEELDRPVYYPSMIRDWLFLGDDIDARNLNTLILLGISAVLNVASECRNHHCSNEQFEYCKIATQDYFSQDLKAHFKTGSAFLKKCKENNKKVLVHCHAGISRSPSFVIYYLMEEEKLTFEQALNEVVDCRVVVSPNESFIHQLKTLETRLLSS